MVQIEQPLQAHLQAIDLLWICHARLVKHLEHILDVVFDGIVFDAFLILGDHFGDVEALEFVAFGHSVKSDDGR